MKSAAKKIKSGKKVKEEPKCTKPAESYQEEPVLCDAEEPRITLHSNSTNLQFHRDSQSEHCRNWEKLFIRLLRMGPYEPSDNSV
ncbi:uncharacterized protein RB166_014673 [Leptodactylus fuscus]